MKIVSAKAEMLPVAEALIALQQDQSLSTFIRGSDRVCTTPGCVHAASKALAKMDMNVEPCDDFYRFACGGFLEEPLEPDTMVRSTYRVISEKRDRQFRIILEEPTTPMEPKPFTMAKNLYKSCMNHTARETQGLNPLLEFLKNHGGWPVLMGTRWNEEYFSWTQLTNLTSECTNAICPADVFLPFYIDVEDENSTTQVLHLGKTYPGLRSKYLTKGLKDDNVMAYHNFMVDIALMLGANRQVAEEELLSVLQFEMKLAKICREELRNSTESYIPMTINQLSETYPSIPWKAYLTRLLAPSIQVDDSKVIIVDAPSFISSLEKLINETPKRIQANHVIWRFISGKFLFLNNNMRERFFQYETTAYGMTERRHRWKECVDSVYDYLRVIVNAQYVRKFCDKDVKKNVSEMVDNIRSQFYKILQKANWLDVDTRKSALSKVTSMTSLVAYPDEFLDDSKLEELYPGLELSDENYFQGIVNLTLFDDEYRFSKLRKPVNDSDWVHATTTIVNAFYSPSKNSIEIPAGILQGDFFSKDRPRYMNYGAIGSIIGHEITHGFDNKGSQYDDNGNLVDWWLPSTKEKYLAKVQSIIDQYGNYSVMEAGLNLNGSNSQGENIADNVGFKIAYLAYIDWSARNGQEQALPGLPYTPRQMFWISGAHRECKVYRLDALKQLITTNPHVPAEFRILGSMSNSPEFARDFKCPMGSKMNPETKNIVW